MKRLVCLKENKIVLFREKKVLAWLIELDWLLHCLSVCLIDWLIGDRLMEKLLIDCLLQLVDYWMIDCWLRNRKILIDWFLDGKIYWLIFCSSVDVLFDRLRDGLVVGRLAACGMINWSIACLLACLLAAAAARLIDWLTDWLICS